MNVHFLRVADYGYTKLKELFEALPNVVQILGEGSRCALKLVREAHFKSVIGICLQFLAGPRSPYPIAPR